MKGSTAITIGVMVIAFGLLLALALGAYFQTVNEEKLLESKKPYSTISSSEIKEYNAPLAIASGTSFLFLGLFFIMFGSHLKNQEIHNEYLYEIRNTINNNYKNLEEYTDKNLERIRIKDPE